MPSAMNTPDKALGLDEAKTHPERFGWLKYRLRNALVYQSPAGHCFTDCLDRADAITPEVDDSALTAEGERYLREQLSSNHARTQAHVELACSLVDLQSARVLDIGCGPGAFLAALRARGATQLEGLELMDDRLLYAQRVHGLQVHKQPLSAPFWQARRGRYDLVTLWDVVEHLDFPERNLREAASLLRPSGYLVLDAPCRDGSFHRIGDLTYRASRGRFPTLLNLMYASHAFGHKQILSLREVRALLEQADLHVQRLDKVHELALPTEVYLRKLLSSPAVAARLAPFARAALATARPWNKVRAIAQKA